MLASKMKRNKRNYKLLSLSRNYFFYFSKVNLNPENYPHATHISRHVGIDHQPVYEWYTPKLITNFTSQKQWKNILTNYLHIRNILLSKSQQYLDQLEELCFNKTRLILTFYLNDCMEFNQVDMSIFDQEKNKWRDGYKTSKILAVMVWNEQLESYVLLTMYPISDKKY